MKIRWILLCPPLAAVLPAACVFAETAGETLPPVLPQSSAWLWCIYVLAGFAAVDCLLSLVKKSKK